MLRGLRLASVLAAGRRTLLDAIEEAPDRFRETPFTVVALRRALVEYGQRCAEARVATFTGRHTLSIGRRI
ncbi:MAG: hypothetical protein AMJ63_10675 [Myxococcales bacterium SG8_38_1]|nr:MAG: hypothetical protein AMJ63_10675 [Myxococcales bacterium SG8_38_1]